MRPRKFEEDDVLTKAFAQFWRGGVKGTTISDIARVTGVQRGSLYNAYGSKEALFLRAYERYAQTYLKTIEDSLSGDVSFRKKLESFFATAIYSFTKGSNGLGCPTTRGLMEVTEEEGGLDDEAREAFASLLTGVSGLLRKAFEDASNSGQFSGGDPDLAADHVLAVARGMVILDTAFEDVERLERIAAYTIALVCSDLSN